MAVMAAYTFTLAELLIMAALLMVVGGLVAFLGLSMWRSCRGDQQRQALVDEVESLREYKREVNEHFRETADQFQQLTGQYRAVYEHMAQSARTLCDEETGEAVLQRLHSGLLEENTAIRTDESNQVTPDKHYLEEDRSK